MPVKRAQLAPFFMGGMLLTGLFAAFQRFFLLIVSIVMFSDSKEVLDRGGGFLGCQELPLLAGKQDL